MFADLEGRIQHAAWDTGLCMFTKLGTNMSPYATADEFA